MASSKNKKKPQAKAAGEQAKKAAPKQAAKAPAKKATQKKAKKGGKPGFFTRIKNYFGAVKTEMHRVVWPTKKELFNYSIAVIVSLVVVGVVIAGLDTIISEALVLISGLRG